MRSTLSAMALLLLAGCGGRPSTPATATLPEGPEVAECRAEGRNAPGLQALARQANPANQTQMDRLDAERAQIESRAFTECLRRRGLSRGGGVEPVRRSGL